MKKIPKLTVAQMRKLDRLVITKFNITLEQMMENAGKSLARLTRQLYPNAKKVMVAIGPGNNGGGGLVAARHLANQGAKIVIIAAQPKPKIKAIPKQQLSPLEKMNVPIIHSKDLSDQELFELIRGSDVCLDALLGYSLKGVPKGEIARCIELINVSKTRVIALDIPSGLNVNTGKPTSFTIKANATLTLALPKVGLGKRSAKKFVGKLFLADISIPLSWYHSKGIKNSLFKHDVVIRL